MFVGDLMQHQAQIDADLRTDSSYDYSHCFSLVKERISRADLAIGNLEVTLGGEPYRGYLARSLKLISQSIHRVQSGGGGLDKSE